MDNMSATIIEQIKKGFSREDSLSRFQTALLAIHLQRICVPLVAAVGLFTVFYLMTVGQLGLFVMSSADWGPYNRWRIVISALNLWMVLAVTFSKPMRRNFHTTFSLAFLPAVFFSGYYLSMVGFSDHALTYSYYLQPFYALVLPGGLRKRVLTTAEAFFMLPGIYLVYGWEPYVLLSVGLVLGSSVIVSVLVGHFAVYRLNRVTFLQERQLERQNDKIQELAQYDQLTGLYTRRELDNRLQEEFARARRHDEDLSVLMVDLDHFKRVNDQYGHNTGDEVLETFGGIVTDVTEGALRKSDIAGRFGGEEFCVVLPETDREGARIVGERLRKALKETEFTARTGETFTVTCSVGVAELQPKTENPEKLLSRADQALYDAKSRGRDNVTSYSNGPSDA